MSARIRARSRMRRLDTDTLPGHLDRHNGAALAVTRPAPDAEDRGQELYAKALARPWFVRRGDDLPDDEAAEALAATMGTITNRYSRGREKAAEVLDA